MFRLSRFLPLEDPSLSNPFSPSDNEDLPPVPERPNEDNIPKVYTLGYDGILFFYFSHRFING